MCSLRLDIHVRPTVMLTLSQLKKKNMRRLMPEGPSWRLHRYKQIPPGGRYELGRTSSLLTSGTLFSDLRTLQHRNTVFIIIVHVIILIIIWTIIFSSCIAVLWFATTSIKKVRLGGVHLSLKMEHFQNKVQSSFFAIYSHKLQPSLCVSETCWSLDLFEILK